MGGERAPRADEVTGRSGTRASAEEIHENVLKDARKELERPAAALGWSGLGAGLTIAFSSLGGAFLASIAPPPLAQAARAAGYPLGFLFVVLARGQLFTENTLEPVLPLLEEPSRRTLSSLLRLWAIVLSTNLAGAALIALAIALMAWLVAATHATGAQIAIVWLTTAPISALGFRHSIAGGVDAFTRAWAGDAPLGQMAGGFLLPAILGNIVGGVALVALLNHGQVVAGRE
jgi:formate/nitrite transporter FocA (FNT family)